MKDELGLLLALEKNKNLSVVEIYNLADGKESPSEAADTLRAIKSLKSADPAFIGEAVNLLKKEKEVTINAANQ